MYDDENIWQLMVMCLYSIEIIYPQHNRTHMAYEPPRDGIDWNDRAQGFAFFAAQ